MSIKFLEPRVNHRRTANYYQLNVSHCCEPRIVKLPGIGWVLLRMVSALVCLLPTLSAADNWSFDELHRDKKSVLFGFLGGLFAHELGHISVATIRGVDFEFDGLSIVYPEANLSDKNRLLVASAGFQVQWLASEIAFHYLEKSKADLAAMNTAAGVILSHLGVTAAYLTFLKNHSQGDIEGMSEATGISNDHLALAVAVPALLDGWRLLGTTTPNWVPQLSVLTKGIGVAWAWTY